MVTSRKLEVQVFLVISNPQKQSPEVFCKKAVLNNFTKLTRKHLCQSFFFYKRPVTSFKKLPWHICFPINFVKFLRTPFLQNTSGGCF